jgi:PAS domain S-box
MNLSNLRSRGFLLVMFPLLCQFAFVGALLITLNQMQIELLSHSQSRRVVSTAHKCTMDLLRIVSRAYYDDATRADGMMDREQSQIEATRLKKPVDAFLAMLREDPAQAKNAKALTKNAEVLRTLHEKICQAQQRGLEYWWKVRQQYEPSLYLELSDYLDHISDLISVEELRESSQPLLSSEFRTKLTTLILFAVAISVIATIVLAIIFAKTIRDPLKHVSENSRRMTQRQKLLPLLRGTDEIVELDRFLHTAADALETELSKEQSMVDNAPNMICTFDADAKIVRINSASERLLGRTCEELVQTFLHDLVVVGDLAKAEDEFEKLKRGGEGRFDLRLKRRNGTIADTRWECLCSPATGHVFAVVRDVTQEKNVERLKEDFLDMITHDLRSPLTSIHASMTLIDEGVRGEIDDSVRQEVGAVLGSVEHLIEFVNDVLDFQKLKAGRMQLKVERVELDSVINDSVGLLDEFAQSKRVSVKIDCPSGLEVECDRSKMIQVMTNLLSNAIRFSPNDSSIEVNARVSDEGVTVHVLDNGSGIPDDMISKIFEAFEQVASSPKSAEGTGLGLAISKLIVEAHGGTIDAANRLRGGKSETNTLTLASKSEAQNRAQGSDFFLTVPLRQRGIS